MGGVLWEITDPDNPSTATNLGNLPSGWDDLPSMNSFATKDDILGKGIEMSVAEREMSLFWWFIGILSVSMISFVIAEVLIRTFISN